MFQHQLQNLHKSKFKIVSWNTHSISPAPLDTPKNRFPSHEPMTDPYFPGNEWCFFHDPKSRFEGIMGHQLNNPLVEQNVKNYNASPNRSKHSIKRKFLWLTSVRLLPCKATRTPTKTVIVEWQEVVAMSGNVWAWCGFRLTSRVTSLAGMSPSGTYEEMVSSGLGMTGINDQSKKCTVYIYRVH